MFRDEMEIHRHPTLTRVWAPVGERPEVPALGKNEKKVVYGAVDYVTGKPTYTAADKKCGPEFIAFLAFVLEKYARSKRRIRMVCDNDRFHTSKAVLAYLEANKDGLEVYWPPPYCPDLNLIERLWGHLKRTVLANVLYRELADLVWAFRVGTHRATVKRERMGFVFKHDDLHKEIAKGDKGPAA